MGTEGRTAPRLGPLDLLAAGLERYRSEGRALWGYYAASLPFAALAVAALEQALNTRMQHVPWLSAMLATAYAVRVWGAGWYSRRLLGVAGNGWRGAGKAIWNHAAMLLAWLLFLPLIAGCGLFFASAQHAALDPSASLRSSMRLAASWWGLQWPLLSLFLLFGAILLFNTAILALLLPTLGHMLLGTGGAAASAGGELALLQESAYWLGLLACVYLALDPWVRATFVVAHERLKAHRSGEDLIERARRLPQSGRAWGVASALALALGLLAAPRGLPAQAPGVQGPSTVAMGQAIHAELQRPEYRWHNATAPPFAHWLDRAFGWIFRPFTALFDWVANELGRFFQWLSKWLSGLTPAPERASAPSRQFSASAWLVIAIAVLLLGLVLLEMRRRRRAPAAEAQASPTIEFEAHEAAAASEEEWFAAALRLQAQGEWRGAFRAAFLAGLAYLGQRQWIQLRADRTNRDYRLELARRARLLPAEDPRRLMLEGNFRASAQAFDAVWYGGAEVDAARLSAYLETQRAWVGL